jgi:hypothetical protein
MNAPKNELQVSWANAYGRHVLKPENKLALQFAELVKQKVFTAKDIERIRGLGFSVRVLEPEPI